MENFESREPENPEVKPESVEKKKKTVRVVCAYCGKDLGAKEVDNETGTSHGACQECKNKWKEDLKKFPKIEGDQY